MVPRARARRAGAERAGFEALAGLSLGFSPLPAGTPAELSAVRRAIAGWEVTTVVIPNLPRSLPPIERGNDPQYAAGFMTAALGRLPVYRDHAWVWTGANRAVPVYRVLARHGRAMHRARREGALDPSPRQLAWRQRRSEQPSAPGTRLPAPDELCGAQQLVSALLSAAATSALSTRWRRRTLSSRSKTSGPGEGGRDLAQVQRCTAASASSLGRTAATALPVRWIVHAS